MIPKSPSDDTLVDTFVDTSVDNASVFTHGSDETVAGYNIFGTSASSFSTIIHLPIVSNFLHPGLLVVAPGQKLPKHPLLTIQPSMLSFLRKNSPILVIHSYANGVKHDFCKVYFKIVSNNLTSHVLKFPTLNETVVLLNNGIRPSVDVKINNTKLRILGVSGAASTFGSGPIKIYVLKDLAPSLSDSLEGVDDRLHLTFSLSILYDNLIHQDKAKVNQLVQGLQNFLLNIPFATLTDSTDSKSEATIKLFATDTNLSDLSWILTCILLVLRDQETRKMRGNKPTYV